MSVRPQKLRGFTLLELVVVISIVGILGGVAAERLLRYAEFAEKTAMEYTANIINSALLFEYARRLTSGAPTTELADVNPMRWLAQPPANYLGEFKDAPVGAVYEGNWYYDAGHRELVYLLKRADNFEGQAGAPKAVRYRVTLLYDQAEPQSPKVIVAAVMKPVMPYRWFVEAGSRPGS